MNKYIKDGKIGILVSPGFGSGWSTWNDIQADDARFVKLIDEGKLEEAMALANELHLFNRGLPNCKVVWLESGIKYKITENDGSETIEYQDYSDDWEIA